MNLNGHRIDSVFHVPLCYDFKLAHYCNNGLLLFIKRATPEINTVLNPLNVRSYIVWNPFTQEKSEQNSNEYGDIWACFYHPLAKECRLICVGGMKKSNNWEVFSQTFFAHEPRWEGSPPVVLNNQQGGLPHWMIADAEDQNRQQQTCCEESIIMFYIRTETFSAMPHPADKCGDQKRHGNMRLLDIQTENGISSLCLCDCTVAGEIEMWVPEDYEKRVWVRRHKIIAGRRKVIDEFTNLYGRTVPFGSLNGELLFHCIIDGLFAYTINKKTMRKISDARHLSYAGLNTRTLVSLTKSNN